MAKATTATGTDHRNARSIAEVVNRKRPEDLAVLGGVAWPEGLPLVEDHRPEYRSTDRAADRPEKRDGRRAHPHIGPGDRVLCLPARGSA